MKSKKGDESKVRGIKDTIWATQLVDNNQPIKEGEVYKIPYGKTEKLVDVEVIEVFASQADQQGKFTVF